MDKEQQLIDEFANDSRLSCGIMRAAIDLSEMSDGYISPEDLFDGIQNLYLDLTDKKKAHIESLISSESHECTPESASFSAAPSAEPDQAAYPE